MSNNIVSIRLVSGEELITEYHSFPASNESLTISRPFVLQVMHFQDSKSGLVLVPWFNSNPEAKEIQIAKIHILGMTIPLEEVMKSYLSQTSGIKLI